MAALNLPQRCKALLHGLLPVCTRRYFPLVVGECKTISALSNCLMIRLLYTVLGTIQSNSESMLRTSGFGYLFLVAE